MINRTQWPRALSAISTEELLTITGNLTKDWKVRPKSIPQAGLGMLKLNDSAFEEPFYLGEFPLASVWLEIQMPNGQVAEGAAQIMDDRLDLAEALALCDAIMSAQLPGWEIVAEKVDQGISICEEISRKRKKMLASTQVDFSLLDDVTKDYTEGDNVET